MFNFTDYLEENNWIKNNSGIFEKEFKTIKMVGANKLMIALNLDKKVKHKHIVTCKIPKNEIEAEILFSLTMLKIENN